ncbi:NAD(P)H-binding protein [Variovorax sp. J31P179]|uniref:NAD(P)-dependent oxidoreductase n=1 Tax=Variovorax sp. J31P179 TaxID=3053508 RepID=UPI00257496C3|nr:NAD(P)H-binding protein [Variovorax sp. J31P179]MDM0085402.1 NAD(P)H-binding protein [Variovorax sp. J31P179]
MKIALIGATGSVGSRILTEALARGHTVTALSRHPEKVAPRNGVQAKVADLGQPSRTAEVLKGHDVVVSSVRFKDFDVADLLTAVRESGVGRLVVVGGAGSLRSASGQFLVDAPTFPEMAKPEAQAGGKVLDTLRSVDDSLNWTFLSPSATFTPGERTGSYRKGKDDLLVGSDGKSGISQEDYALALVDELEAGAHPRERFTVGY